MAWKFFKILDTSDYNYLIDRETNYPNDLLIPYWDKLVSDYEQKTQDYSYSDALEAHNYDLERMNKINGLTAIYYRIMLGYKDYKEDLKVFGIEPGNEKNILEFVKTHILRLRTKLNIEKHEKLSVKHKKQDFLEFVVQVENTLNRSLDAEKLTLTKWIYLVRSARDKIKQQKKHGKNYRS